MKQELLENLVRICVREVLEQVKEADGDPDKDVVSGQAELPQESPPEPSQDKSIEQPSENPDTQESNLKGVILVNPRDKSKLQKVPLKSGNDAGLERSLHKLISTISGANSKVSLSALRMSKDAIRNPSNTIYLYVGKYDPSSEEIFLMADKSLQIAKDSSVSPNEIGGSSVAPITSGEFEPTTSSPNDFASRMTQQGKTPSYGVDEGLKKVIKKVVREILKGK